MPVGIWIRTIYTGIVRINPINNGPASLDEYIRVERNMCDKENLLHLVSALSMIIVVLSLSR